jgi:hypothetical protein
MPLPQHVPIRNPARSPYETGPAAAQATRQLLSDVVTSTSPLVIPSGELCAA